MACSSELKEETIASIAKVFTKDIMDNDSTISKEKAMEDALAQATKLVEMAMVTKPAIEKELADMEIEFGNTADSKKSDWKSTDAIREDIYGSVESMKGLLKELHDLGATKASDEHYAELEDLFDKMDTSFFEKMTLHVKTDAAKADGIITGKTIKIHTSKVANLLRTGMSEAEVYAHETVHGMLMFAFRSKDAYAMKLKSYLQATMYKALSSTKWEDFAPEDATAEELKEAKALYEYIFNSKNAPEEFMTHTLTNPKVMEVMRTIKIGDKKAATTIWGRVKELFAQLMHILAGDFQFKNREGNVYEITKDLAFELAALNNRALNKRNSKIKLPMRIWDNLQTLNVKSSEALGEFWDKHVDNKEYGPPPLELKAKAIWMSKMIVKMVTNVDYRKAFELILHGYGMNARGDIQTIFRDFFTQDSLAQDVDMLALATDTIDTAKNTLVSGIVESIHAGFTRRLTKEEEGALTKVLIDTDMQSISKKFDRRTLAHILRNKDEVDRRLRRAIHALQKTDGTNYAWNVTQAKSLGYYMATGKGYITLNLNAQAIVTGGLTGNFRSANHTARALVDEIATLTALQYTKDSDKEIVAKLMTKERNGVENILQTHAALVKESAKDVFGESKQNMIKGYSKEIFDDNINIRIAANNKATEEELAAEGYVKKHVLSTQKSISGAETMAVYISTTLEVNELYRTSMRFTAVKSRGTSISSGINEREDIDADAKYALIKANKRMLDDKRLDLANDIAAGKVKFEDIEYGMMPVTDENGSVTDYRYVMDKDNKEKLLGQSLMVSEILGKSFGSVFDKKESYKQNEKILDIIVDDMKQNYVDGESVGNNNKRYIFISAESTDSEVKDLYSRLPKLFKDAMNLNEPKGLAVREDLFHAYFGYRHISITNNKYIKMITPAVMLKIIKTAEFLWMEFIKITKVDILIKMPVVIVGNLISNFIYGVLTGTDPFTLADMYIKSARETSRYFKMHAELTELKIAKRTGNVRKLDLSKIPFLENSMKDSSIHELATLGIYQSIAEDLDTRDLESTNKIKKEVNAQLNKLPDIVKTGLETLYLTENTAYYKFMNNVLTKSDLVARDIENKKLKLIQEKQARGEMPLPKWFVMRDVDKIKGAKYTKTTKRLTGQELKDFNILADAVRHNTVLESFVNYNKPSGRVEEYLNKMGFIMFTKYFKRIQKVTSSTAQKNPLNVAMLLLGESYFGDVDTIYDQTIFTKSLFTFGLSGDDWIPGTDPFTRIMEVMNPPLIQLLTDPKVL